MSLYISYLLCIRRTVLLIKNVASTIAKKTTTIVLTTSSETVPSTIERGLLAIASTERTVTITITIIATIIIQHATITTNRTIRIGSIATRTIYTLRKAFLAPI